MTENNATGAPTEAELLAKLQPGETLVWLARDSTGHEERLKSTCAGDARLWVYRERPLDIGECFYGNGMIVGSLKVEFAPDLLKNGECKAFAIREIHGGTE